MRAAPITKQQYVYQTVRENILTGALEPGTRLTLAEMSEQFGVSPIPIREALRQLEQEGLIEMTPHVKIVVRGVTVQEAIWVAELRIVLEPPAAREAAAQMTDADLDVIRQHFVEMEAHADAGDEEAFQRARLAVNDALFSLLPNRRWHRTLLALWETLQRYRNVFQGVEPLEEARAGTTRIMEALTRRDLDGIEQCYRERRQWSLETLLAWAARVEGPSHDLIEGVAGPTAGPAVGLTVPTLTTADAQPSVPPLVAADMQH